jgi:hypothetical protein
MKHIKSFEEFVNELKEKEKSGTPISADVVEKTGEEIGANIHGMRPTHPLDTDKSIYKIAIITLGIIAVVVLVSAYLMICYCGKTEVPSGIIAIGATAVGALAGLFSLGNRGR